MSRSLAKFYLASKRRVLVSTNAVTDFASILFFALANNKEVLFVVTKAKDVREMFPMPDSTNLMIILFSCVPLKQDNIFFYFLIFST